MKPVIDVRNVTFAYGDTVAIEDVTLSVEAGTFLGLIGPNGSGKTTLLHLMIGLLEPDRGSVELFGQSIEAFEEGERIGYVSQGRTDRGATMPVTVREVVTMGRYARLPGRRLRAVDRERVAAAMETVEIDHLADRRISALSGGQRQRAFIARALAAEADLLALDEPTVGVDAESCEAFYALLESLTRDGMTIVLIEHDVGVVTEHVDQIACLNRRLHHHGDTDAFLESDALAEAYGSGARVVPHHHH